MGQPGQADKFLKVLGDKLRPVVGNDPRGSTRIFLLSSLQDDLDVELRHGGAQFPMHQETRTAVQGRAEIEEGPDNVQIRYISRSFLARTSCHSLILIK
jgi:hypothetical protein